MRIELDNDIKELATATSALEAFSRSKGLDTSMRQAAEVVLDELLCNIISYGQAGSGPGAIVLELETNDDCLLIRISDCGIPFNPFDRAPPDLKLSLEEREPGGLGIHLVRDFMDQCHYEYVDGRNTVTLSKKLAP